MKNMKSVLFFGAFLLTFSFCAVAFAQTPPAAQTAGGVVRQEVEMKRQKAMEARIEKEREMSEEVTAEEVKLKESGPKVLVNQIVVEGATLLSSSEIRGVTSKYEGQELSLKEMQKIADLITDEYRKKGYVTSRAYIPPQSIQDGILKINIVEGKLGKLDIKGNQYFSTALLRKKMELRSGGYFDYSALQQSMVYINESPDRTARAILVPGKQPGTTDLIVEVDDNYPFHVGFEYDNWGSRYIGKHRYALVLEHNNLFGQDDKINVKAQFSEGNHLRLQQARYIYPLTPRLDAGGYVLLSKTELGEEFESLDAEGEAEVFGLFLNQALIEEADLAVGLNLGLDKKSIRNDLLGVQTSHDELRIFKGGVDLDVSDRWGRTIITAQMDTGVADLWGAMSEKDYEASRAGAGGKFTKGVFNLFRLQPMPFMTSFLWKNSAQISNYNLVASEQFQIGGATSVRGYPPAEYSGDTGYYTAFELSIPVYPLSKDIKVPFYENVRLYDALRLVLFYDLGYVHTKTPAAGEVEDKTLHGLGFGARLNVIDDLELRVEVGYPWDETPSDGDHAHAWIEFDLKF